ncbi:sortase-associated OmpA-like protein PdsO [Thaumasiovibrio sp. DFM-14]|uniref:sortase-associated OmpA-like protein PdsO n=1 Tax=Thaumasiovibrio sp. DFM-14 TaxID=3384792 RepID=UPI0039A06B5A
MNNVIKATLIATMVSSGLVMSPAYASSESATESHQLIGLGSGAAFGAVVGGPAGAVIGAMVGGIVGTATGLSAESDQQRNHIVTLEAETEELAAYRRQYMEERRTNMSLVQTLQAKTEQLASINVNVQFQTGSAELASHYLAQLDGIAELIIESDGMQWLVEGHADRVGDPNFNLELSQQRADAVKDYLIQRGVSPSQITLDAFGDTLPVMAEPSLENNIYDRRVTVAPVVYSMAKE